MNSMAGKVEGLTIGIDLGTTYSCVAVWKNDGIEIIPNDLGNRTTPSCVAFTREEQLVGEAAVNQAAKNPTNTIFSIKRLIGRGFSETSVQEDINEKLWQCKVVGDVVDKPMIGIQCKGKEEQFSPEKISSMILGKMRDSAEAFLGSEVKNAVITVPSYFNVVQRQATRVAATMAGLNVVRIINEPVAAALAYGLDNNIGSKGKKIVLVFDLGGGTFDVTILTIEKGNFEVKSYGGDTHLGGDDFDSRMVEHFIREFQKRHSKDIRGSERAIRRLRTSCEKAKRLLSSTAQTTVEIDALYDGADLDSCLSRARFEESNKDLFAKCIEHVEECLKHARINKNDIDDVVLVGGSTRIPKIQQLLQDCFHGKKLCKSINPDEAVAYGAAVLAASMSGVRERNQKDWILVDVSPLSLGVSMHYGTTLAMIPRNTPIPCMMEKTLVTTEDNQISVSFQILEGERARCMDNICLGKMVINGIPPAPRGKGSVKCCFSIDEDGILTVRAKSETIEKEVTLKDCVGRFSKKEIDQIIQNADRYKKEDEKYRRNAEAKNELENLLYNLKIVIRDNKITSKMAIEDINKINEAINQTIEWLESKRVMDCEFYSVECSDKVALLKAALDSVNSSSNSQTNPQQKPRSRFRSNIIPVIQATAAVSTLLAFLTGTNIPGLVEAVECLFS